ncbi:MAG: AmmeMemoRadiSam system protein B [Rectinemataceae bacterium]
MGEHSEKAKLREAIVSGIFYPDDHAELDKLVRNLVASNRPQRDGAAAIFAPHAGFRYSGDIAALAWNAAAGRKISVVCILAPMHRPYDGLVYLPESDFFDGPFGPVRVDTDIVEEMMDCGTLFRRNDIPHFEEHGIEVQLPFMRALFPAAALVPVVLGAPVPAAVKALAAALDLVIAERKDEVLIVVSSDLSTGLSTGPSPDAEATTAANRFLEKVEAQDWRSMIAANGTAVSPYACGAGCLAAFLSSSLAEGKRAELLGRHDSSLFRETPDERLVHYAAIAYYEER